MRKGGHDRAPNPHSMQGQPNQSGPQSSMHKTLAISEDYDQYDLSVNLMHKIIHY